MNFSIAVILPVYNGIRYLEQSVESVLMQDYKEFEFLVCDDCSTDESYKYLQSINDDRVKLFRNNENKGLFPTLNFLLTQTRAHLVHLWAQDDIMLPNCLGEVVRFHENFPQVNFSFSRLRVIDENNNVINEPSVFEHRSFSPEGHAISSILHGSIAGNIANVALVRKAVEAVGYFNEQMKYSGDFDMWCKLSKNKPVGMYGGVLVHVREHKGQLSKNIDASYFKMVENFQIYQCFLSILEPQIRKLAVKALKWKIYPSFFRQYLFIRQQGKKELARKYLKALRQYDSIFSLSLRWFTIRFLRLIKLEYYFYNTFLYKPIEKLRNKHE